MQVISGNTEIAWPVRSPDEAPCDYFLWGICDQDIRRVKFHNLSELQEVVKDFVETPDEDSARRAVRDVRPRAEMCIKWAAAISSPNIIGERLRSKNILTAWH